MEANIATCRKMSSNYDVFNRKIDTAKRYERLVILRLSKKHSDIMMRYVEMKSKKRGRLPYSTGGDYVIDTLSTAAWEALFLVLYISFSNISLCVSSYMENGKIASRYEDHHLPALGRSWISSVTKTTTPTTRR